MCVCVCVCVCVCMEVTSEVQCTYHICRSHQARPPDPGSSQSYQSSVQTAHDTCALQQSTNIHVHITLCSYTGTCVLHNSCSAHAALFTSSKFSSKFNIYKISVQLREVHFLKGG